MQDHPQNTQGATSYPEIPEPSSVTPVEHGVEGPRARLTASANALRRGAASRLNDVRERVAADMLRKEAAAFIQRLQRGEWQSRGGPSPNAKGPASELDEPRPLISNQVEHEARSPDTNLIGSLEALRQRAASSVGDIRGRVSPDALMPFWRVVTTLPARLRLSSADVVALSQANPQGSPDESGDLGALEPMQDAARITVPLVQPTVPAPSPKPSIRIAQPVSPKELQSPRPGKVRTDRSAQAGTVTRIQNDALVRTALDRPVLVGSAAIALGVFIAALSSAGTAQQRRPERRSRAAGASNVGTTGDSDAAPVSDDRLHPERAAASGTDGLPDEDARKTRGKAPADSGARSKPRTGSTSRTTKPLKPSKAAKGAIK